MKKDKRYWNFRVVTKLYIYDKETYPDREPERLFSVCEVYYTDGKPDSYIESKRILGDMESVKGLKWTTKKIKKAFNKPILDIDNWPNKWKN
jgi:hypothetical protein